MKGTNTKTINKIKRSCKDIIRCILGLIILIVIKKMDRKVIVMFNIRTLIIKVMVKKIKDRIKLMVEDQNHQWSSRIIIFDPKYMIRLIIIMMNLIILSLFQFFMNKLSNNQQNYLKNQQIR